MWKWVDVQQCLAAGDFELIGAFHSGVLVVQMQLALFAFDQHALHERVRLEALLGLESDACPWARLTLRDRALLGQINCERTAMTSCSAETTAKNYRVKETLAVNEVEAVSDCASGDAESKSFHSAAMDSHAQILYSDWSETEIDRLKMAACKGAVKITQQLSSKSARGLLRAAASCVFPMACAHGRPTCIHLADV